MADFQLKWGICSAGKISNDFVLCLNMLPKTEHKIVAVGARSLESAEKFAKDHSIPTAYGSYEEVADDADIGIAYIGAVHTQHFRLSKMMLEAGKHVLCEKPLCVTLKETEQLIAIAKSKGLFLMEGLWSRCFPAYAKARELIEAGAIGEVRHVQASFGEYSPTLVPRIREKELAGGALLDRGVYPVQFVQHVFNEKPIEEKAYGSLLEETGVDTACHIFLRYSSNRTALVSTSVLASLPNEGLICGTHGTIRMCFPIWCPTKLELSRNFEISRDFSKPEVFEFSLPGKSQYGQMNFRNSEGFVYEAQEVRKCIMEGRTESPLITHQMSLHIAEIMNIARKQIGYTLPQDGDM